MILRMKKSDLGSLLSAFSINSQLMDTKQQVRTLFNSAETFDEVFNQFHYSRLKPQMVEIANGV